MARQQGPSWRTDKRSATERGYGAKWRKARATYLHANPLCIMCERRGHHVPSVVVDHRIPHRGAAKLFWDRNNWQALCKPCHDSAKSAQDRTGIVKGNDASGRPIDPEHPWNRQKTAIS